MFITVAKDTEISYASILKIRKLTPVYQAPKRPHRRMAAEVVSDRLKNRGSVHPMAHKLSAIQTQLDKNFYEKLDDYAEALAGYKPNPDTWYEVTTVLNECYKLNKHPREYLTNEI